MSKQYNVQQDINENLVRMGKELQDNIDYIKECGGELFTDDYHIIAGIVSLWNARSHKIISDIADALTHGLLSKSTYTSESYIDAIEEAQKHENYSTVLSDLEEIFQDEDLKTKDKLNAIKEYLVELAVEIDAEDEYDFE